MSPSNDPAAEEVSPVDPGEVVEVTVMVRPKAPPDDPARIEAMSALPVADRRYPSRSEYAAAHGADPADLEAVAAFGRAHGLLVKESDPARRSVVLSGSARSMSEAFGVGWDRVAADGGAHRVPVGAVALPPELAPIVEAVMGLDDRPHARPHPA